MDTRQAHAETRSAPPYPVRPIAPADARDEPLFAFGRLFAKGPDGRWALVEAGDAGTDD